MEIYPEKIYCINCLTKTNHFILKCEKNGNHPDEEYSWIENFHIGKCCGCDTFNYFTEYFDEDFLPDEKPQIRSYPSVPYNVLIGEPYQFREFSRLPANVKKILNEVKSSLSQETPQPMLLTMAIRMILEAITIDLKIKKGWNFEKYLDDEQKVDYRAIINENGNKVQGTSLPSKIFKLYDKHIISLSQFKILIKIKDYGNAAAHEITAPNFETIVKMISIVEDILFHQYELERILD